MLNQYNTVATEVENGLGAAPVTEKKDGLISAPAAMGESKTSDAVETSTGSTSM